MLKINYNPDVLSCLANLSNDEVFTPPTVVNHMLDRLPQDIWKDKNATFLDPVSKSGVFLREIAKRLLVGLEEEIPDLQERINHIFTNQLYGIAITELTSLLSRRSVYCSKLADGKYSVTDAFETPEGNIIYNRIQHEWLGDKCKFCGATKQLYDRGDELETHAYQFIHSNNPEEIFGMKFDVIVGNPPYQLNVGVEKENYAVPLYHSFVHQAKKLNPRFLTMIIPSRWFAGGRGLDEFRSEMLNDNRLRKIVDYPNAVDCFPGVDISGGVCYFLWDRDNKGECEITTIQGNAVNSVMTRPLLEDGDETFIRFNQAIPIVRKIKNLKEKTFDELVSPQTPFGFVSSFKDYKKQPFKDAVKIYTVNGVGYIQRNQVTKNQQWIDGHKVYISKSYGERGSYPYLFLAKPFIGDQNSCCTQTYLMIGPFDNVVTSQNVRKYIQTRFFRFLIMLRKNTQDAMRGVYSFVPVQDFSQEWTDEKLYKKYGITEEEISFIESMVRPMELANE
jgi:site-specific DNA-methyltransferase (adenine-specific)